MEVLEHLPVGLVHRGVATSPGSAPTPSSSPRRGSARTGPAGPAPPRAPHPGQLPLVDGPLRLARPGAQPGIENAWLEDPERPLWHHRWNLCVLNRIETGDVTTDAEGTGRRPVPRDRGLGRARGRRPPARAWRSRRAIPSAGACSAHGSP
jgi:hypothetical protein